MLNLTTLSLILLTVLTLATTALAWRRLLASRPVSDSLDRVIVTLTALCGLGSLTLFLYRWLIVNGEWRPLTAHVDGLLLIAALLTGLLLFLRYRSQVPGIAAFGLPILTLILAWAICASAWTFHPFRIGSVWLSLHLASIYVGTALLAVAAFSGGMYLFAERRLRRKQPATPTPRLGSLEAIERVIIRTSAAGFGLLTVGLVAGFVIYATDKNLTAMPGWWYAPKITLAVIVWCIYALVTNVRHTTLFRGRRAAWLSILGLLLLLAVWILSISFLAKTRVSQNAETAATTRLAAQASSLSGGKPQAFAEAAPCAS